jgi:hypothetical protein
MFGDILSGAVNFGTSYIGGKKRLARREEAQTGYDASMADYFSQDTSNLYSNLENTMEDLTVNTQAAEFAAQQQAQGLSNIMGSMNQAAGGSGIAALAQSLANQQAQSATAASASIGQQESMNQRLAAQQGGRLQELERAGAGQSRALKAQLLGEEFQINANELASSEEAIQAARAARTEALGQFAGGVGNALTGGLGNQILSKLSGGQKTVDLRAKPAISAPTGATRLNPIFDQFGNIIE